MINGTDHKGSTYNIGRILAEKLSDADNISEIFLPRDFSDFCCGCTCCFSKSEDKCPHYQKLRPLTDMIDNADVLIFTSPVYVYHTTGQMKAFLDHYGWRWMVHRPEEKMFSKQAAVITTAAGAGMKYAIRDIADSCFFWGIPVTYKFGRAVKAVNWEAVSPDMKMSIDFALEKIAGKIKSRYGNVPVPLKTRGFFRIMSLMQKNGWNKADMDYWNTKGWTGKKRPWN